MKRFTKSAIVLAVLLIGKFATAATYVFNGKEITKGQAIELLIKDPNAKVMKQDLVYFDKEKGSLKNRPKN